MQEIPTADDIVADVEHRIGLLSRLVAGGEFEDEEWNQLVFYGVLHRDQRQQFIDALAGIRAGGDPDDLVGDLAPHARWLAAVYSGHELTGDWCAGGSRFHGRVVDAFGGLKRPSRVLREVRGLREALVALKRRMPVANPQVIDNIAIDETFEQLGRAMG